MIRRDGLGLVSAQHHTASCVLLCGTFVVFLIQLCLPKICTFACCNFPLADPERFSHIMMTAVSVSTFMSAYPI